jgi:hypothetical protein
MIESDAHAFALPDAYEAVFPIPARSLGPNGSKPHPARLNTARQEAKELARRVTVDAYNRGGMSPPLWDSVAAQITVNWENVPGTHPWDNDNLSAALKPYLDGIAAAGVLSDDRVVWDWRVTAFIVPAGNPSRLHFHIHPETPHHAWLIGTMLDAPIVQITRTAPQDARTGHPGNEARWMYPKGAR